MSLSFDDIVCQVNSLFKLENEGMELKLCARFDAGQGRFHYAVMLITSKDDWLFYKQYVKGSQVGCAEIVVVL
jgi:hypothetical protein